VVFQVQPFAVTAPPNSGRLNARGTVAFRTPEGAPAEAMKTSRLTEETPMLALSRSRCG
jgi:hypothetical protein